MSAHKREIRAVIVDDNPRFRLELRDLLELEQINVVGEAGNGWEAIELTQSLDPDVVLMDQNMPALSGIAATRHIKRGRENPRVIFLAAEEVWRDEAVRAGADGYFVKGDHTDALIGAIHNAEAGHLPLSRNGRSGFHRPTSRPIRGLWLLIGLVLLATSYLRSPDLFPIVAMAIVVISMALYLSGES